MELVNYIVYRVLSYGPDGRGRIVGRGTVSRPALLPTHSYLMGTRGFPWGKARRA